MKKSSLRNKILFSLFFLVCLLILKNTNQVKAATPTYIWPIGGDNAGETYMDYDYYGKAGQAPYKDGKSGREYKVNNALWPNEKAYYNACESHFGMDITGINGHSYKVVSIVDGTVIATSAQYAGNPSTNYVDRNQRRTTAGLNDGGGYGNYIIIQETSTGRCFLYAHLKGGSFKVSTGSKVTVGQEIATMGSSGDSGHMHLHLEIRKSKQATINTGWGLGLHRFYYASSANNLDPKDYIGSAPVVKKEAEEAKKPVEEVKTITPAKIEKITFIRYTEYRQINIYFDKNITVKNAPKLTVRVGNEVKEAKFDLDRSNEKKLVYTINYDEFDIFASGYMFIECDGKVIDSEDGKTEVACKFDNSTIGTLKSVKIKNVYKGIVKNGNGLGDVNNDGYINSIDASKILKLYITIAVGGELSDDEKEQLKRADVNQDGKVNSTDATLILSYYADKASGRTVEEDKKALICDVNGDETVDVDDYNLLKNAVAQGIYIEKYDLNLDNSIDNKDVDFFMNTIKKIGYRA